MAAGRAGAFILSVVTVMAGALPAGGRPAPPPRVPKPVELLKRAAEAAADIEELQERVTVLAFIGRAYHDTGDKPGADRVLKQALDAAGKIEEDTPLFSALNTIMSVEARRGNVAAALKAADVMENKRSRPELLTRLVHELASEGHFKAALKAAELLKGRPKEWALAAVEEARAVALARAGKIDDALKAVPKAEDKYELLTEIALAQARAKQPEKAKATLAEAARELAGEEGRGRMLQKSSLRQLAAAGEPALALTFMDKEKSPALKTHGLLAIAEGLLDGGRKEKKP